MSKPFRRMFARYGLCLGAALLSLCGPAAGQERRGRPTLEGGVQQQERRPTTVREGVRQREEAPEEWLINSTEGNCRDARQALDLYYRAYSNTDLVLANEWMGLEEKVSAGLGSCLTCPIQKLNVYIELLRQLQLARPNPAARADSYRRMVGILNGNEPPRRPVSLAAFDQAVQRWRQKIEATFTEAEECYRTACVEVLRVMRDALPTRRRVGGVDYGEEGEGGLGRGGGTRRSEGDPPPLPPAMPPTLSGGVEEHGPANAAKKKARDDKTGPPPWAIAIAGGVFLATEEGVKDLLLPAAATGLVCVSAEGIKRQIAEAAEWELYSWDRYKDLQGLDRDLMVEAQRHMERVDQFTREARDEPGRHAEALRRLEQQERLAEQRYRVAQKSSDQLTRETAQDRYEQDKYLIQKARALESDKHAQNVKVATSRLEGEAKVHRRNLERLIEESDLSPEAKAKLKAQAEGLGRFLRKQLGERQEAAGRAAEQARAEHARVRAQQAAERHVHLENFRREWEAEGLRHRQTMQALGDEWEREKLRHDLNPFKNEAEGKRHGEALARINARTRCAVADHLVRLDAIRLKYQVW